MKGRLEERQAWRTRVRPLAALSQEGRPWRLWTIHTGQWRRLPCLQISDTILASSLLEQAQVCNTRTLPCYSRSEWDNSNILTS
jgi:hypothetical protein